MTITAMKHGLEAVVIGGSAGALDALAAILTALKPGFSFPIAVVLHVPPTMPSLLPSVLTNMCRLPVTEPEDKEPLAPGTVYLAPPGYHMLIERERSFSFSVDALVHYCRPSIDVLFESAADAYGARLAGVLLSGANDDGARGLLAIRDAGGATLVQAPETAAARTMPEAALRMRAAESALSPASIGAWLAGDGSNTQEMNAR